MGNAAFLFSSLPKCQGKLSKIFRVTPIGKPRMSQRDKGKHSRFLGTRPCVARYYAYKDSLHVQKGKFTLPLYGYHIVFYIPPPKSWPRWKKQEIAFTPHLETRPDKDNLEKAFLDALYEEDSCFWSGTVTKLWSNDSLGRIEVYV